MGISTWLTPQKYNAVVKYLRGNIRVLMIYNNKDDKSLTNAFDENNNVKKDDTSDIIDQLKENKHSRVILKLEYPYQYNGLWKTVDY